MKRLLLPLLLLASLAACDRAPDATPADTIPADTTAAADPAPAAGPAAADPVEPAADPATADPAMADPTADGATSDPAATDAADADTAADATSDDTLEAEAGADAAAAPAALPPPYDPATSPRPGIDYQVLATPQPTFGQGGIEVAEVFAYTCIHCANLQPAMTPWKAAQPADVRVEYVPAVFGGVSDNFARAYFAAQATGVLDATHDELFTATLVERALGSGSLEEIADWYASQGSNREAFLSTMQSFAVTTKLNRAKQFATRTGINATPTVIVNGKYSASMTGDRGPDGLLRTIEYLVAHERAGSTPPAP